MKGEVETQFLLSGLLLHTQPLHSSEQHTRAHLEFSSHFDGCIAFNVWKTLVNYKLCLGPQLSGVEVKVTNPALCTAASNIPAKEGVN
jgi:hypothetical protein